MSKNTPVLGVDIGASGIKGAIVDIHTGQLLAERYRLETPKPSTPAAMAATFAEVAAYFDWKGPIGAGFPALVKHGVSMTASNIDKGWIGTNVETLLSETTGCPVKVVNDADAAGIAEMHFGYGKGKKGTVILITIGSGLGSAIFLDGKLLPNTELGHLFFKDGVAEQYASDATRKRLDLSREAWAARFNEYLLHLELLFSPDLFILGGGSSKNFNEYKHMFTCQAEVAPARLLNNAGLIGAAWFAVH